ncbi:MULTISPECIES: DUF4126 domain-containing protein [unclassified Leptolyngbya]|uniref:DUF4126 domain-containing protein n=1 Tax=unclassified Leptolyngbya TaxID=2650499 RepID=UPI001F553022|nr:MULTISPECIES: DUF4126 domain-containing protein [unclassified Leptolyngbya]
MHEQVEQPRYNERADLEGVVELLLSSMLGVSLSAATGFRVFVPFLVMSIAAQSGHLSLAQGFSWIGTVPALIMFAIASLLEVGAYYIPWIDELLDLIATPIAVVAGVITTASVTGEMSPLFQWTLAIIAGGSAAGLVKGMTDVARLTSTATTGGLANPLLATMELGSSTVLSLLAIALPLFTGLLVIGVLVLAVTKLRNLLRRRA